MSKAYKCDICGKLFVDHDIMLRKWNITSSRSCGGLCLDICETCQDKLDNLVENKEEKNERCSSLYSCRDCKFRNHCTSRKIVEQCSTPYCDNVIAWQVVSIWIGGMHPTRQREVKNDKRRSNRMSQFSE